jgi:hypothetical protein
MRQRTRSDYFPIKPTLVRIGHPANLNFPGGTKEWSHGSTSRPWRQSGCRVWGAHHGDAVNKIAKNEKFWKLWLEAHYKACSHPSFVGMSEHELLVGRKMISS